MLILGGAGQLYGGIVGSIVFLVARDRLAGINPQYWYFWIGLILMLVVLFMPRGVLGGLTRLLPADGDDRQGGASAAHRGLKKSFGSLSRRARHLPRTAGRRAPCADRSERRRQDHAHQSDHRQAAARFGPHPARRPDDITALAPVARVKRGLARTFQINTLFPRSRAVGSGHARRVRAARHRRAVLAAPGRPSRRDRRGLRHPARCTLGDVATAEPRARLWPAAAAGDRPGARHPAEGPAPRRAGGRRARGESAALFERHRRPARTTSPCCSSSTTWTSSSVSHRGSWSWCAAPCCSRASPTVARRPSRARSLSRHRVMAEPLLELRRHPRRIWRSRRARRHLARGAGGRQPGGTRPKRRGQDDAAADDHGLYRSAAARSIRLGRDVTAPAAAPARARRASAGCPGARHLPLAHRRGEPDRRGAARPLGPSTRSSASSRASRSGARTWATTCPAANSRCWPSPAR